METTEKPRLKYSDIFVKYQPGSVADLIERYTREMEKIGYPVGKSQGYCMRRMQKEKIGAIAARKITKQDIKDHAQFRKSSGVIPSTALKDFTNLRVVLKYAGAEWDDCDGINAVAVDAAMPSLMKHGLVGKSEPRSRRPADEEHTMLLAYFAEQNNHPRTVTDMVRVARWQKASARRIGETCALLWIDWLPVDQVILVRKMKDPHNRNKMKWVALTEEAQEQLLEMAYEMNAKPELRDQEPRIFPYNAQVCSARYTQAKKDLGIVNLHLHDSRRDCCTRLVEDKHYTAEQAILVSGHETTQMFNRVYLKMDPKKFKDGPAWAGRTP